MFVSSSDAAIDFGRQQETNTLFDYNGMTTDAEHQPLQHSTSADVSAGAFASADASADMPADSRRQR